MLSKSGGKGKWKELNLTPIHEDEELDELGRFDSGNFPTIDTLDENNEDIGNDNLSWNVLTICVELYLILCDLVMVVWNY